MYRYVPVHSCHDENVGAEIGPDHLSELDHLAEHRSAVEVGAGVDFMKPFRPKFTEKTYFGLRL
jgi:hypothetical protein